MDGYLEGRDAVLMREARYGMRVEKEPEDDETRRWAGLFLQFYCTCVVKGLLGSSILRTHALEGTCGARRPVEHSLLTV